MQQSGVAERLSEAELERLAGEIGDASSFLKDILLRSASSGSAR